MCGTAFDDAVKAAQVPSIGLIPYGVFDHVMDGLVIFIHEDDNALLRQAMKPTQNLKQILWSRLSS